MSSRVLVTGAAGFIGSHVCRCLIHKGCQVVGLDDLSGGFRDHLPNGAQFVQGSITDTTLMQRLFAEPNGRARGRDPRRTICNCRRSGPTE